MTDFDRDYLEWQERLLALRRVRVLFIVGCAKSGTTWLQRLLGGHPNMVVDGEGSFYWRLHPALVKALDAFNQERGNPNPEHITHLRDLELQRTMRGLIDGQFLRYVERSGKAIEDVSVVGDKTPMHTTAIPGLASLYPGAKFIHIVRDPRDVANSHWHFAARADDKVSINDFVRHQITKVWPLNVLAARHAGMEVGTERYLEVRYEDLLEDEGGVVRRMLGFLGVDDSDDAVASCRGAGDFRAHAGGRERGSEDGAGALNRKGVAGDWANHLPHDVVAEACGQIPGLLRAFGYDPAVTMTA